MVTVKPSPVQQMNAAQRLQIWSERIADCRSSGMSVREWRRKGGLSEKTAPKQKTSELSDADIKKVYLKCREYI